MAVISDLRGYSWNYCHLGFSIFQSCRSIIMKTEKTTPEFQDFLFTGRQLQEIPSFFVIMFYVYLFSFMVTG